DAEAFYREAIKRARLPGKYYVQLAHFYKRTGKDEKLKGLLADYEKDGPKDPDYWLTLTRLNAITGDPGLVRSVIERALQQREVFSPFPMLLASAYNALNLADKSSATILAAAYEVIGLWFKR